jgi:hypothetical protein
MSRGPAQYKIRNTENNDCYHRDHDFEELLLAGLRDLCLDIPQAGNDLALLVTKEPKSRSRKSDLAMLETKRT